MSLEVSTYRTINLAHDHSGFIQSTSTVATQLTGRMVFRRFIASGVVNVAEYCIDHAMLYMGIGSRSSLNLHRARFAHLVLHPSYRSLLAGLDQRCLPRERNNDTNM